MAKFATRLLVFIGFITFFFVILNNIIHLTNMIRADGILKTDTERLATILAEDGCLSNDVIDGKSRYIDFVNGRLRSSETEVFKYDIAVDSSKRISNNVELGSEPWNGTDNEHNPLKVQYTSYLTAPQRDSVVSAELTIIVYTPTWFSFFVEKEDSFAAENFRMKDTVTREVKAISSKYYKGREVKNAIGY